MNQKDQNHILSVHGHPIPSERKKLLPPIDLLDQIASLFSIGPYYYYIQNFKTSDILHIHSGIKAVLGLDPSDFNMQQLEELIHPDDKALLSYKEDLASEFFTNHTNPDAFLEYKVMYVMRVMHRDGRYRTILHQTKALNLSEDGSILMSITVHTDVSYLKIPITQQISFVSDTLPCYYAVDCNALCKVEGDLRNKLSTKEKDIIRQMSMGKTSKEISEALYVSVHTVNTHKKNILKKANCVNTAALMSKCLMEGIL